MRVAIIFFGIWVAESNLEVSKKRFFDEHIKYMYNISRADKESVFNFFN